LLANGFYCPYKGTSRCRRATRIFTRVEKCININGDICEHKNILAKNVIFSRQLKSFQAVKSMNFFEIRFVVLSYDKVHFERLLCNSQRLDLTTYSCMKIYEYTNIYTNLY